MAGEIASAFVSLLPSAAGFQGRLESETSGPMRNASNNLGKILTAGLLAAGAAAGAGIAAAIGQEKSTDRMAAALGLSPAQSKEAGSLAGRLFKDAYGESVADTTGAVEAVMGSFRDLSGSALESVSRQALDFAAIFETDLPSSIATASTVVRSGLAKDATEALDLMTASMQKVPPALRESIADAATEYAPYLADLGFTGEAAFGLLVAGADQGEIGIDKVGDSLKEFGIRATDMSTASVAAYDAIGLNAETMANKLLAGGDTASGATKDIVNGLLGIEDPASQANAAIALFGTPLEDMSVTDIPNFLQALSTGSAGLGDFEGAIDNAGATLNDNAATNFESFKRQITQTFVETLGGKVLPKVDKLAKFLATKLGPAVGAVTEWVRENKTLVSALAVGLGTVAVIVGTVTLATKTWAAAQALLNIVLAANPLGLVILAIAGLVAGLIYAWKNSETFRDFVTGAWEAVKDTALAVFGAIRDFIVGTWDGIKSATTTVFGAVKAVIETVLGAIKGVIGFYLNGFKLVWGTIFKAIKAGVELYMNGIKLYINTVVGVVKGIFNRMRSIVTTVVGFFINIKDGAVSKFTELVTWVTGIPGRILSALGDLGSTLFNAGKELIQGLIDGIGAMFGSLRDAMGNVGSTIAGFLPGSPVKEGPLRSWNNGGAGKRLMGQLAAGIEAGTPGVRTAALGVAGSLASIPQPTGLGGVQVATPRLGAFASPSSAQTTGVELDYDRLAEAMSRARFTLGATARTAAEFYQFARSSHSDMY